MNIFIHRVTDLRTGESQTFTPTMTVRDGRTGRIVRQEPVNRSLFSLLFRLALRALRSTKS